MRIDAAVQNDPKSTKYVIHICYMLFIYATTRTSDHSISNPDRSATLFCWARARWSSAGSSRWTLWAQTKIPNATQSKISGNEQAYQMANCFCCPLLLLQFYMIRWAHLPGLGRAPMMLCLFMYIYVVPKGHLATGTLGWLPRSHRSNWNIQLLFAAS